MYISVDVGGTNTRVASVANLDKPVFTSEPLRQKNAHDFEKDLSFIVESVLNLAQGEQIRAVGIGAPGLPDDNKNQIKFSQNLPSWVGKPLTFSLSEALSAPVYYDGDVVAAGLGEFYYGHTKSDFDYIIWGTGIGGVTIRNEQSRPEATVVDWDLYFREWESSCGGYELAKRFGKSPEDFTDTEWDTVSEQFKKYLESYVGHFYPKVIVFGGGLAVRHAQLLEEVGQRLGVDIKITEFGDNSGLIGGLGLIRFNLDNRLYVSK